MASPARDAAHRNECRRPEREFARAQNGCYNDIPRGAQAAIHLYDRVQVEAVHGEDLADLRERSFPVTAGIIER